MVSSESIYRVGPTHTKSMIRNNCESLKEDGIEGPPLRVSLICPISKRRIVTPCRSSVCKHIQCFDALVFLKLVKQKSRWKCPICAISINYQMLIIDDLFVEILDTVSIAIDEIEFNDNGDWTQVSAQIQSLESNNNFKNNKRVFKRFTSKRVTDNSKQKTIEVIDLTKDHSPHKTTRHSSIINNRKKERQKIRIPFIDLDENEEVGRKISRRTTTWRRPFNWSSILDKLIIESKK